MLACRINNILVAVLSPVTVPVQFVTTLVGGCLVGCTFGLLLLPMDAIWLVFMGLLIATSWLWAKASVFRLPVFVALARIPIAVIGIPLALIAEIYISWMPHMGNYEGRQTKLITCWIWPFSLDYLRFSLGSLPVETPADEARFRQLLQATQIATGAKIPDPEAVMEQARVASTDVEQLSQPEARPVVSSEVPVKEAPGYEEAPEPDVVADSTCSKCGGSIRTEDMVCVSCGTRYGYMGNREAPSLRREIQPIAQARWNEAVQAGSNRALKAGGLCDCGHSRVYHDFYHQREDGEIEVCWFTEEKGCGAREMCDVCECEEFTS